MLHRRDFLKTAALWATTAESQPARPPNLLFILAGEWRAQSRPSTPTLDQLAQQGIRFERVYSAYPSRSPARAALIAGRYPHACGVPRDDVRLPPDQPSIAQVLKNAGYETGAVGEWGLDGAEDPGFVPRGDRRHGFDYWAACNKDSRAADFVYFRDTPEPLHGDETNLAINFLQQNRKNPFFLFLAFGPPSARDPAFIGSSGIAVRPNVPDGYQDQARMELSASARHCAAVDRNIGRVLRALDEQHLANDTIVVFTSDRGAMLGSQGLEDANVPFEESVRVPLIVRYPPKLAPESNNDALISSVALMPTLLGLCGAEIPPAVQGQDLSSWISGRAGDRPESIYCMGKLGAPTEWHMVVRALDKLVVDRDLHVTHLYNLGKDPYELNNLAHDPAQNLKRAAMEALLNDWMRRTGDRMDPSGLKRRV
jgi:arylsulfatase A-like enzyme